MRKILIIEDEDQIRTLYQRQLEKAGFLVDGVANTYDAKKLLGEESYALILLDIMLPGEDGLTFLEEMQKNVKLSENCKVIVITNLGQQEIIKEAYDRGAIDYIIKVQNTPDQIVEKVKSYMQLMSDA